MIKKITAIVSNNKKTIAHRALVVGGSVLGVIIAEALFNNTEPDVDVVVIENETDVATEETEEDTK